MSGLTHFDDEGRARMVDVGGKEPTQREAVAQALIAMSDATAEALFAGELPKGDARAVARIAAIMGAKQTPQLVPLCHPIALDAVEAEVARSREGAVITVRVRTTGRTGVEMEAMTGAAIGAVAVYDMIKGLDRGAEIGPVRLLAKSGGRSGEWRR
jgi:cyclic pyranopterin phosphate synthase